MILKLSYALHCYLLCLVISFIWLRLILGCRIHISKIYFLRLNWAVHLMNTNDNSFSSFLFHLEKSVLKCITRKWKSEKKRPLSTVCHCYHVTSTKSSYSKSYAILFVNWWFSLKRCSRVTLLHCDQQAELTYRWQRSPWSPKSKAAKSWEDMTYPSCSS